MTTDHVFLAIWFTTAIVWLVFGPARRKMPWGGGGWRLLIAGVALALVVTLAALMIERLSKS